MVQPTTREVQVVQRFHKFLVHGRDFLTHNINDIISFFVILKLFTSTGKTKIMVCSLFVYS